MKARDPYPWMSADEAIDRLREAIETEESSVDFEHTAGLCRLQRGLYNPDGVFSSALSVAALTKAIYALKAQAERQ